jgi:hypothetical protein
MKAKLGPDHPDTLTSMNNLAWSLATAPDESLRNPAKAVEYATQAVERAPQNACFRGTLGSARYCAGDPKGAIAELETAINLRNGDDEANASEGFFLAMAHWQISEKDKAHAWFEKSVRWMEKGDKDDPELKRFRAQAAMLLDEDKKEQLTTARDRGIKLPPTPCVPLRELRAGHVGLLDRGRYGVDDDATAAELAGEDLGEGHDRGLHCGID